MNVALKPRMTLEAFLAWEARQERKWEFDGTQPVAMTGVTDAHSGIQTSVIVALGTRLRGQPCRVRGPELQVSVAGSIRYPDAFVACSPVAPNTRTIADPVVIFEVLSDSTQRTDRVTKNREYAATPSVHRYVMLEQHRVAATVFHRQGGDWVGHLLLDGATLEMPEIGLSVPLAEFYIDIALPEAEPEQA